MSKRSVEETRIFTLHPELQVLLKQLFELDWGGAVRPFVVSGMRTETEQNDALKRGVSSCKFLQSPHNVAPSLAVDLQMLDLNTGKLVVGEDAVKGCIKIGLAMMKLGAGAGTPIKWGGLWLTHTDMTEQMIYQEIVRRNALRAKGFPRCTFEGGGVTDTLGQRPQVTTFVDAPHCELQKQWDKVKGDKVWLQKNAAKA